jgi:hypothetical protein
MAHNATGFWHNRRMPEFQDWAYYRYVNTIHDMTEEQRLAYNVKQLGVTGAAEYEERRNRKFSL